MNVRVSAAFCIAVLVSACAPETRVASNAPASPSPAVTVTATAVTVAPSPVRPHAPSPAPSSATPLSAAEPTASPVAVEVRSDSVGDRLVTLTEQRKNKTVYTLRADSNVSTRFAEGTGESRFVHPKIVFYGEHDQRLYAESPSAVVHERERSVTMTGGVRAHTNRGMTLTSDTMRYDDAAGRIYSDGNVIIATPQGQRLLCAHVDSDVKFSNIHCTGAH